MKYYSKKSELTLVMVPQDRVTDEHRRTRIIPGKRVEFFNGLYQTHDPEIIDFMDKHPYKNKKFVVVKEDEIKPVPIAPAQPIATGMLTSYGVQAPENVEAPTRPTDNVAISPELVRVIDERINSALSVIVDLLKKDEKREEKVLEAPEVKEIKGTKKAFKCPYCGEPFKSGFEVGKHKKECPKRS